MTDSNCTSTNTTQPSILHEMHKHQTYYNNHNCTSQNDTNITQTHSKMLF